VEKQLARFFTGGKEGQKLIHQRRWAAVADAAMCHQPLEPLPVCLVITAGEPVSEAAVAVSGGGVRRHLLDEVRNRLQHFARQFGQDVVVLRAVSDHVAGAKTRVRLQKPNSRFRDPKVRELHCHSVNLSRIVRRGLNRRNRRVRIRIGHCYVSQKKF